MAPRFCTAGPFLFGDLKMHSGGDGTTTTIARSGALEARVRDEIDVLVIGGGIVGAGVARDAAMRGFQYGACRTR